MDCSLPGFSIHGIFQARILEWVAMSFSRGSSRPRNRTRVSCIASTRFTIWATREAITSEPQAKPKSIGVGSLSLLQQIFPTQELSWGLLHRRQILYQLSYQETQDSALSLPWPGLSLWREIKILLQAAAGWDHLKSAALRQEWDALGLGWKEVERCSFSTVLIKPTLEANFWNSLEARISRAWTIHSRKYFHNLDPPLKILRRAVRPEDGGGNRVTDLDARSP